MTCNYITLDLLLYNATDTSKVCIILEPPAGQLQAVV